MYISYHIQTADGSSHHSGSADLPEPPEKGTQVSLPPSRAAVYDVVAVRIYPKYKDYDEYAVVSLKLHLPNLDDIIKPIGHDGPCHPTKLHEPPNRDALATEVMRRVLDLDIEELQRTLLFLSGRQKTR